MKPFWYPQSALLLPDPPSLASAGLLRRLLARGRPLELLYTGDRMWPALRHEQRVSVVPLSEPDLRPGAVVLCCPSGIPDLFRVAAVTGDTVRVRGDADPHETFTARREDVLALALLPVSGAPSAARVLRRIWLDLEEAARGRPDDRADPAGTVKAKYDAQAPFYAHLDASSISADVLESLRQRVPAGGRVLVAGSGTGQECTALVGEGWTVTGVDFSSAMVELARRRASAAGIPHSALQFLLADLTRHEESPGSLAGIYFTYDVHSFIPEASARARLLERMYRWLAPDGVLMLSARRIGRPYDLAILSLQRAVRAREREARWGHSHTRWIAADGSLRRSFVHVFTRRGLERETSHAGFRTERWIGNHCVLVPVHAHPR